jgi:hypothetical protein
MFLNVFADVIQRQVIRRRNQMGLQFLRPITQYLQKQIAQKRLLGIVKYFISKAQVKGNVMI